MNDKVFDSHYALALASMTYQQTFHMLHSKREVMPKGPAGKLIVPTNVFVQSHESYATWIQY
jgi:hypothetical protein